MRVCHKEAEEADLLHKVRWKGGEDRITDPDSRSRS